MKRRRTGSEHSSSVVHALLYTRVSGAEHQKEGLSLEAQTRATRGYAVLHDWVIGGEFKDILSGGRDDRPQYQALLSEVRRLHSVGNRAVVVVTRLDRLGRHLLEQVRAREELKRLDCDTHVIKEGGVLPDLTAHILMSVGQDERQRIGARVAEVRSDLVLSGWHYGRPPFGYRKRPATADERAAGSPKSVLEPDPATRGVALETFQRVAAGASINAAAKWIAALPEGQRGGRLWPAQCVSGLLRSPSYVARPAEGADDVLARPRARWEPLVPDELWDAVQTHIAGHATRPHQASGRYLLTGFVRCPRCAERMVASRREQLEHGRRPRIRSEYRCTGWTRGANAAVPGCRWAVPMHKIDQDVLGQVGGVLDAVASDPNVQSGLRRAWADRQRTDGATGERRTRQLEGDAQKARERIRRATELFVDGQLDKARYDDLCAGEQVKIDTAEHELAALGRLQSRAVPTLPPLEKVLGLLASWSAILQGADIEAQRAMLGALVEHVVADRDGYRAYRADITWSPLGAALVAH
jgi:DNA invertase Pin-like site-specific DNA recombinase